MASEQMPAANLSRLWEERMTTNKKINEERRRLKVIFAKLHDEEARLDAGIVLGHARQPRMVKPSAIGNGCVLPGAEGLQRQNCMRASSKMTPPIATK